MTGLGVTVLQMAKSYQTKTSCTAESALLLTILCMNIVVHYRKILNNDSYFPQQEKAQTNIKYRPCWFELLLLVFKS